MIAQLMVKRLGDEAKIYDTDRLQQMVFEIAAHEEGDRSQMGAKDSRLLGLFLSEKAKMERQQEANKPLK